MDENKIYSDKIKAMTKAEFERVSTLIYTYCGIKMPPIKKTMLESRLQKRLRLLGMRSFRDYCSMLFDSSGSREELLHMVDAVTTNKTDFFREPSHFSYLAEAMLPEFKKRCEQRSRSPFTVWSAGCSSGEEPYTLAIVLSEYAAANPGFRFSITATDISTRVLDKAQTGIYDENQTSTVPTPLKWHYFLRSKDHSKALVRIIPELRSLVTFHRLNLMDEKYMIDEGSVDALFCRNVIIYFDRVTQRALLSRLYKYLRKDGCLFLGHSETVHGFDLPLARIASTIYRKVE